MITIDLIKKIYKINSTRILYSAVLFSTDKCIVYLELYSFLSHKSLCKYD